MLLQILRFGWHNNIADKFASEILIFMICKPHRDAKGDSITRTQATCGWHGRERGVILTPKILVPTQRTRMRCNEYPAAVISSSAQCNDFRHRDCDYDYMTIGYKLYIIRDSCRDGYLHWRRGRSGQMIKVTTITNTHNVSGHSIAKPPHCVAS